MTSNVPIGGSFVGLLGPGVPELRTFGEALLSESSSNRPAGRSFAAARPSPFPPFEPSEADGPS